MSPVFLLDDPLILQVSGNGCHTAGDIQSNIISLFNLRGAPTGEAEGIFTTRYSINADTSLEILN